ncbi:deoxyribonuclease IV [Candidatus Dependentiae bacterium]|nr:deoxyribonuclease IV [Candidatus Dependentiae bacterium]
MKKNILLGAHVSISKGFDKAIEEGEKIGCTAIQIFTKSNRSWFAKKISDEEIENFKESLKNSQIKSVVAHASYLINLGSSKKEIEKKSIKSLETELERCEKLGIPILVLHPGAHLNQGEEKCIKQIAKNLDSILKKYSKTKIALETTAGQGTNVGYKFEQIKKIRSLCKQKNKIGACIDTCHIFSAGYNISTPESYKKTIKNFIKIIGLRNLKAIHLNDSKTDFGSRKDRHANIGKGKIPKKTFELIMNDKHFSKIPKILETPIKSEYPKEIKLLRKMVK